MADSPKPVEPQDAAGRRPRPRPARRGQDYGPRTSARARGAGREEGDLAAAVLEPQAGGGAVIIRQDFGAFEDVGLLEVRGGMVHPRRRNRSRIPADGRVEDELPAEDARPGLAGPVVLGRTEAAHDEDRPARPRASGGPGQVARVVADDRLAGDVEPGRSGRRSGKGNWCPGNPGSEARMPTAMISIFMVTGPQTTSRIRRARAAAARPARRRRP